MRKLFTSKPVLVLVVFLAIVTGVLWTVRKHSKPEIAPVRAVALSPLFDPRDKSMNILLKGVEVESGRIVGFNATIRESKSRYNQMKQAVLAYLQGPRSGATQVAVPEGLGLNEFYLTSQGMAVVDLSTSQLKGESFGFYAEALFIRGMIETLTGNFFEVKQVKVLVNGQDAPTLGGHYALGTSEVSAPVSTAVAPVN
jgi:hypothetical protein